MAHLAFILFLELAFYSFLPVLAHEICKVTSNLSYQIIVVTEK